MDRTEKSMQSMVKNHVIESQKKVIESFNKLEADTQALIEN